MPRSGGGAGVAEQEVTLCLGFADGRFPEDHGPGVLEDPATRGVREAPGAGPFPADSALSIWVSARCAWISGCV